MKRYGKISLNIRNLNPEVVMHRMVTTLKANPFLDSSCKKLTTTFDELRQRVAKFIKLEKY